MVNVAHEVVQVVDGVEADAGLRLERPQRLRQIVLLRAKGIEKNRCFYFFLKVKKVLINE